jgi:hypothetical protein
MIGEGQREFSIFERVMDHFNGKTLRSSMLRLPDHFLALSHMEWIFIFIKLKKRAVSPMALNCQSGPHVF